MNHWPHLSARPARQLSRQAARALLSACALLGLSTARAEADGPDFYRLRETPPQGLAVHLAPHSPWRAGWLPRGAQCLRNLGCQGGLTLQAFSTLTPEQRAQAEAAHPRWCEVAWQGLRGWVDGLALTESSQSCAAQASAQTLTLKAGRAQVNGQIRGNQDVLRVLQAKAGQMLTLAGVIRRGFDGSATVHLQAADTERQLLFVAGQPVSSDSAQPLIGRHEGELWVIEIGGGSESYELPDALLNGS